jgi:hypothetical protein
MSARQSELEGSDTWQNAAKVSLERHCADAPGGCRVVVEVAAQAAEPCAFGAVTPWKRH